MKPLEYKTQHHPTTSNTLYRTPYLNNKQNKNKLRGKKLKKREKESICKVK